MVQITTTGVVAVVVHVGMTQPPLMVATVGKAAVAVAERKATVQVALEAQVA